MSIIVKLLKIKVKEENLKAARGDNIAHAGHTKKED